MPTVICLTTLVQSFPSTAQLFCTLSASSQSRPQALALSTRASLRGIAGFALHQIEDQNDKVSRFAFETSFESRSSEHTRLLPTGKD